MSRFSSSSRVPVVSFDEAEEARELDAFFRQQDPVTMAAVDWHTRLEQGLSRAEQDAFRQWLAASPEHAAAFEALDQDVAALRAIPMAHAQAARVTVASQSDTAAAPSDAGSAAGRKQAGAKAAGWSPVPGLQPRRAWLAMGCVGVLAAGIGWQQWDAQRLFSQQYVMHRGQGEAVTLPDGSELAFDADTQAQVTLYKDRREVRLQEGQILFTVAPNREQPFEVLAGTVRVTVVGTQFSVRYRREGIDADTVKVAVAQGQVRVVDARSRPAPGANTAVDLVAGQGLVVSTDGTIGSVAAVAPGSIAPWRNGLVRFENTPLGDALRELEHYGPTRLVIRDPAVAAMPIGGSFQIGRPDAFAQMVAQILPVKLVRGAAGTTEIVAAP